MKPDRPESIDSLGSFLPITDEAWPASLEGMRGGFATNLNVYRVMAHNPALLTAWQNFRSHVVLGNTLDDQSLEIVILRTGFRRGSNYEWMHHVVRGRNAGLDDCRIRNVAKSPNYAMSADDSMLMRCVDAIIDTNQLPSTLQEELLAKFGSKGILDLIATVGMYSLLACILESFATPIDSEIAVAFDLVPISMNETLSKHAVDHHR
jgi:4-carboxymuconolactone decarboxylase